jgi:hypothetical protein
VQTAGDNKPVMVIDERESEEFRIRQEKPCSRTGENAQEVVKSRQHEDKPMSLHDWKGEVVPVVGIHLLELVRGKISNKR